MKSWLTVVAVALVASLVCAPAASAQTKWVGERSQVSPETRSW